MNNEGSILEEWYTGCSKSTERGLFFFPGEKSESLNSKKVGGGVTLMKKKIKHKAQDLKAGRTHYREMEWRETQQSEYKGSWDQV